jgi:hypothetical protein
MKGLFIFFFLLHISLCAQKQGNIWYFGNSGAGLDFNDGCDPTVLTDGGTFAGFEGCATISDNLSGQLQFYTNSENVWNRNHQVIPNSDLIPSGSSITQVLIVRKPGSTSAYYIITCEVQGSSGEGLRFHGVDMNMNAGLGGMAFKDSSLFAAPVTEKITAVRHSNGVDLWLIAHQYNSTNYLCFLLNSSGIQTTPVISSIGKVHYNSLGFDAIGELKASPDGTRLAAVTMNKPNIELFGFNASTGQISNLITLPENGGYSVSGNSSGIYGLSFSPNSKMLYVSKWIGAAPGIPTQIIQYNVSSNDSATINNTRVNVYSTMVKNLYSLQLAPNKKIYVAQNQASMYLGVIHYPDSSGLSCMYVDNGIYLNGSTSGWGLNNLMEYGNYCESPSIGMNETQKSAKLSIRPNPFSEYTDLHFDQAESNVKVILSDVRGRVLRSLDHISGTQLRIEKQDLVSGFYFLQVYRGKELIAMEKLIIE